MKRMVAAGSSISGTMTVFIGMVGGRALVGSEPFIRNAEKLPAPTDVAHQQGTKENAK